MGRHVLLDQVKGRGGTHLDNRDNLSAERWNDWSKNS